ncbi:MAG TPA: dihydroneopterin aldolase [Candidatus Tumulicola sp.]
MDRIRLRGIRAYGKHGVFEYERERAAPFDIDLAVELELANAARSDDLADTLDYAALHARVVRIVRYESYALLERLAAEIADAVLSDPRVRAVDVTVAKPQILDGATPSVTLQRRREP